MTLAITHNLVATGPDEPGAEVQAAQWNDTHAITGTLDVSQIPTAIPAANIADGSVSNTEFQYINSLTSNAQTQLDAKFALPSLTSGSVLFSNGSTIAQDNANFFWDDANNRLGIGTATPAGKLDVQGGSSSTGAGDGINLIAQSALAGTSSTGGSVTITAGNSRKITSGGNVGGSVSITGGTGAYVSGGTLAARGGPVSIFGGPGAPSGNGGTVQIAGGAAGATAGTAGAVTVGGGTALEGAGGMVVIAGSNAVSTAGTGNFAGGAATISGGNGVGNASGGAATISSGGAATGLAGNIFLDTGVNDSSVYGNTILNRNGGNVGIGTTLPLANIHVKNAVDAASNQVQILQGARATPADNDEIYESFNLNSSTGVSREFGRITTTATSVTDTAENGSIRLYVMSGGILTQRLEVDSAGAIIPAAGTIGPTAAQQHTLPAVTSDTFTLNDATQTLTNKTLTSPTLTSPVLGAASATSVAFTSTSGIIGTTTNDSAAAGSVGEYISSEIVSGSAVSLTTGTFTNITSISLTAGDWDVWGNVAIQPAAGTIPSAIIGCINTVSATEPTRPGSGSTFILQQTLPASALQIFPIGTQRLSLSGTTTVYLITLVNFTISTCAAYGFIGARRVR